MSIFSPQLNLSVKPLAKHTLAAGIYSFAMDVSEIRLRNLKRLEADLRLNFKTQKSIAVVLDMAPSFLSQLLAGKKLGDDLARKIEKIRGLPNGWMDTPQWGKLQEPIRAYSIKGIDKEDGMDPAREVSFPVVDIELSAGNGTPMLEFVETKYTLSYQIESLRSMGIDNAEDAKVMGVRGRSMERTLFHGDKVLIHLKNTKIVSDAVFAIAVDGEAKIKRLFLAKGGVRIVSDNEDKQTFPDDFVAAEDEFRQFVVIGRVKDKSGRGGL